MKKKLLLTLLFSSAFLLSSCGGTNDNPNPGPGGDDPIVTPEEKFTFSLTVGEGGNAHAYFSGKELTNDNYKDLVKVDDSVVLVVTPNVGYTLDKVTVNDEILPLAGQNFNFTIKEGKNDVKVSFTQSSANLGDFRYEIIAPGEAMITSYTPTSATIPNPLVIPDVIEENNETYKVTTLGTGFLSNQNVYSVSLGKNITTLEENAFDKANSLANIYVDEENAVFTSEDGILYSKNNILVKAPTSYSKNIVNIKDGTTEIANNAFESCTRVNKVVLPNSLVKIGDYAFSYTHNVSIDSFPESLKEIGAYAFRFNNGIKDVVLGDNLETLGYAAFYSSDITSVTFNDKIKEIPTYCFYFCKNLTVVNFKEGLEVIGPEAFISTPVKTLNFPTTLKKIDRSAFELCAGITTVNFNEGLEEIGNVAFGRANNIEAIHLPSTLKTIGINPFMGIVRIGNGTNNFTISENNPNFEIVDEVLFSKGENRELITYPYGKQGTTYVIPDGTTRLAEDSFVYILNLTDVTIPVSVTDIHDAFRDMYSEIENDKPSLTVRYLGTKEQFRNINLNGNFGEWHQNTTIANNVVICSDGELTIV